ncbi:type II secretion system protein [Phytohabitans houttuyneae]|uniref:Type II secretion system protein n=2 Tax=Phytohabitans houttuyneae TaxID=1076126 RepID=A0A6V8KC16_9ACTN|nr:type II secretion system F family protein [Phytohabitans houttuyneae]GFJ79679.1 type II secretion system protein [Phytohabitans houttuyneae]
MSGPADIQLIALLSGALCVGGLVLAVASIVGTRSPVKPPSRTSRRLGRLWNGTGLSAAERRRHRVVVVSAIVAGALAWMVTGLPMVGLLVGVAVPGAPWLFGVGRAEKRAIARIEAVGEWTRRLRDVSSTGQGLQQAIIATVSTAPEEIGDEVSLLAARLQAGWHARDALLAFAGHLGDPMCDQVVAALILHLSDRGERLGDVLSSIAAAAAAEVATRREVEAKRTQPRFAVRFLTGMTLLTLAYGLLNPQYMEPYGTPTGQVVLVVLGGTFVALLAWTRAMSLPPAPVRFLTVPDERREA